MFARERPPDQRRKRRTFDKVGYDGGDQRRGKQPGSRKFVLAKPCAGELIQRADIARDRAAVGPVLKASPRRMQGTPDYRGADAADADSPEAFQGNFAGPVRSQTGVPKLPARVNVH